MKRIYLDNCCLNRPFDNQNQPRIRLESEAIKTILKLHEQEYWEIVLSQVNIFELQNTPEQYKKSRLQDIVFKIHPTIFLNEVIVRRAKYFESCHLDAIDAMHLACAENNANVFLTVDDKFLKKAKMITNLNIEITNPLNWLQKVLQ